jgi:hypothetical protein
MASAYLRYHRVPSLVTDVILNNLTGTPVAIEFAHQVSQSFFAPPGRSWFCLCRKLDQNYYVPAWRIRFRLVDPSLYMIKLEDTDSVTMSLEIFPEPTLAILACTVIAGFPDTLMHKHKIVLQVKRHIGPYCPNDCDCPEDTTDTCADDCVRSTSSYAWQMHH